MKELNEIQLYLLEDHYDNFIGPFLQEILTLAKSDKGKEVCIYLILMAIEGTLNQEQYENLLSEYLEQKWVKQKLINLNNLFQPNNDKHIFVRHVMDNRLSSNNSDVSQEDRARLSINSITAQYREKIRMQIASLYPEMYRQVNDYINTQFITEAECNASPGPAAP